MVSGGYRLLALSPQTLWTLTLIMFDMLKSEDDTAAEVC
jgi:hypothetical protein